MIFRVGITYGTRSICDHNCIWFYRVTKRTACTVTLTDDKGETKVCRIKKDRDGNEYTYPLGRYSMCPVLRA